MGKPARNVSIDEREDVYALRRMKLCGQRESMVEAFRRIMPPPSIMRIKDENEIEEILKNLYPFQRDSGPAWGSWGKVCDEWWHSRMLLRKWEGLDA